MSDDLKIAVLGVGMMGAFHVDALSKRVRGASVAVVNDFLADKADELGGYDLSGLFRVHYNGP